MHYRNFSPRKGAIEANGKSSWHLEKECRLLPRFVSAKISS